MKRIRFGGDHGGDVCGKFRSAGKGIRFGGR
jgi:hypothetical protein